MRVRFSENAERELDGIEPALRELFFKHAEKIGGMPPRRHMKFGLPFNVESVTRQARIIYHVQEGVLYILHCFKSHKEYERWYKSFK